MEAMVGSGVMGVAMADIAVTADMVAMVDMEEWEWGWGWGNKIKMDFYLKQCNLWKLLDI